MARKIIPEHEAQTDKLVVLLAEDDILLRFDIADEFRQLGCQVIEAGNADEAIGALRSTARIDIVLTDVRMPGERDGLDVARTVRQERPGVRIVVMSGHLEAIEHKKGDMDLFVPKPTSSDRLAKMVVEFMGAQAAKRNG